MLSSSPEAIPTSFWLHPYREQYSSVEWALCEPPFHNIPDHKKQKKQARNPCTFKNQSGINAYENSMYIMYIYIYTYRNIMQSVCKQYVISHHIFNRNPSSLVQLLRSLRAAPCSPASANTSSYQQERAARVGHTAEGWTLHLAAKLKLSSKVALEDTRDTLVVPENLPYPTTLEPSVTTPKKRIRLDLQPQRDWPQTWEGMLLSQTPAEGSAHQFFQRQAGRPGDSPLSTTKECIVERKPALCKCSMMFMIQGWMDLETARIRSKHWVEVVWRSGLNKKCHAQYVALHWGRGGVLSWIWLGIHLTVAIPSPCRSLHVCCISVPWSPRLLFTPRQSGHAATLLPQTLPQLSKSTMWVTWNVAN